MATRRKRVVAAVQDWKDRMSRAKADLPETIGMQDVILQVVQLNPTLDKLAFSTRWLNAWYMKTSDPEITVAVEQAASIFNGQVPNKEKSPAPLTLVS